MRRTLLAFTAALALTSAAPAHAWSFRDSWNSFTSTLRGMGSIARGVATGNYGPCGYCDDRDGDGQDDASENNNGYGGVSWDGGD